MGEEIILTDNGAKVLKFMQERGEALTGIDVTACTGIKGAHLVLESLIKKGLVLRTDPVVLDFTNAKGETKPKAYAAYALTEAGLAFPVK